MKRFKKSKYTIGHGFRLAQSTIPNSGRGVFATYFFPKGNHISEYPGFLCREGKEKKKTQRTNKTKQTNENYFELSLDPVFPGLFIDGTNSKRSNGYPVGAFINDPCNRKLCNVKLEVMHQSVCSTPTVIVVTTKDIHPGDELFVSYKKKFWEMWTEKTGMQPSSLVTQFDIRKNKPTKKKDD